MADLVHEALQAATVFADTPAALVTELGEQSRLRGYGRGDYVFREGDIGDSLFIIVEGWGPSLGDTLAISDDEIAAGAPEDRLGRGAVFLLRRVGGTWTPHGARVHPVARERGVE